MDSETPKLDETVPRPIGARLAAARIARGLDLVEIARDTRVPLRHLAAIEADDHDSLPALPYAIGFVKAFARAVGIDAEMAGARFRGETSKAAHVPVAPAMMPIDERRLPSRGLVTASIAALVVVIAAIAAWSAGAFDAAPPPPVVITPASSVTAPSGVGTATSATTPGGAAVADGSVVNSANAPLPATSVPGSANVAPPATPVTAAAPVAASGPPAADGQVLITASNDVWFRISRLDPAIGKIVTIKTGALAKGDRYAPPALPGLKLWTGRAGALAIAVDGHLVPALGGPVETVRNVSLDPGDLRARLAAPAPSAPPR